jgi:hypothetical protein
MTVEGGFARYLAAALAPLLPLALSSIFDFKAGKKPKLAAGLLIGGLIITHHTFLITAIYSSLFITIALFVFKTKKLKLSVSTIRAFLVNITIVVLVAFAVAAFWLVPFIADIGYASFRPENAIEELYRLQSNSVNYALTAHTDYMVSGLDVLITYHVIIYHAIVTLTPLIALVFRNRRSLIVSTILAFSYWVAIGLSLGVNGPLTSLNILPIMVMMPPNRWLDAIPLIAAFQTAFLIKNIHERYFSAKMRKLFPIIWAVVLLLPTLTIIPYTSYYTSSDSNLPADFVETMGFIKANTQSMERFYQYGLLTAPANTTGSLVGCIIGYTPVLTNAKTINGWYRQGDPLDDYRNTLHWSMIEAPQMTKELLDAYNVKHVILDSRDSSYEKIYEGLTSIGFKQSFAKNSYRVMSTDKTSYATANW